MVGENTMRLFLSYARVDSQFCPTLIDILEAHEVWYDQRLYVGQRWWDEILRRIDIADGLIFLVSPESLKSEYCLEEYKIARSKGKHVFPIIIKSVPELPEELKVYQHVDMSDGVNITNVKELLNSIVVAEREGRSRQQMLTTMLDVAADNSSLRELIQRPHMLISEAARAFDEQNFDRTVHLLRLAKENHIHWQFVDLDKMLHDAESALEKQSYERAAALEYAGILSLVKHQSTRETGCAAFMRFRQHYVDYDPENISASCAAALFPMLEWCPVPDGEVTMTFDDRRVNFFVDSFRISRYPVTNAQYKMFIDAEDGYRNSDWWNFSREACEWRKKHPTPLPARVPFGDHPRVYVSWYEAMAFCNWLSSKLGMRITLPSEQQWQRAAQGEDGRQYPWGNRFNASLCNTREGKVHKTTSVRRYVKGASPYGAMDMAGNVWEWCQSTVYSRVKGPVGENAERAIRGGSYSSKFVRVRNNHRVYLKPIARCGTIGFRVVAEPR